MNKTIEQDFQLERKTPQTRLNCELLFLVTIGDISSVKNKGKQIFSGKLEEILHLNFQILKKKSHAYKIWQIDKTNITNFHKTTNAEGLHEAIPLTWP